MNRGNLSRTIPILLIVIIAVVAIAAIVSFGRAIFSDKNPGTDEVSEQDRAEEELLAVDSTRSVRLTVRGPLVANEQFRSYQVEVSPDSRNMTTYKGYLDSTIASKTYDNNTPAYEEFVYALNRASMMKQRTIKDEDDVRGLCATGNLYEFEVLRADRTIKKLWSVDCRGVKGTLDAEADYLASLFVAQIPDAEKLATDVDLPYR